MQSKTSAYDASSPACRSLVRGAAAALAVIALQFALAGCNTTEGIGKDVKNAGKGIEEAAQDAK